MHTPRKATVSCLVVGALCIAGAACRTEESVVPGEYLYVWAADSAGTSSDFLAVLDAEPTSPQYGSIVTSLPTGVAGTHPHHTEEVIAPNGHLLANGFHAGRTWLFDLSAPRDPKILASFGDVAGLSHPHSYVRLASGNVLATFQYTSDSAASAMSHEHAMTAPSASNATGGLVEMDERGTVIRSASASDPAISDKYIYPYSVLPIAALDRAVSTTTDMNPDNKPATSEWVQFWRLSDLTLLRSIALKPGPRSDEHRYTGEPRLLPDGKSVYIHTFNCGLYLVRGVESDQPNASLVTTFDGTDCGVPLLTSHYWLQPVPKRHALVSLDITDPEQPREVSSVSFGDDENPHWIALDRTGRRIVLNSAGSKGNRLFMVNFDPSTGALGVDERFRDPGSDRAGISMTGKTWPHGFTGKAIPHGTVFSR